MNDNSLLIPEQIVKLEGLIENVRVTRDRLDSAEKSLEDDPACQDQDRLGTKKTHWTYIVLLIGIGAAEWLINYEAFRSFTGVPAMAAGFTIVVAGVVAYASHLNGAVLKQPYLRNVMRHTHRDHDNGKTAYFWTTIFAFVLVLLFVGWARYAWASDIADIGLEVNVTMKVLITLIGNILVWGFGCFVSYSFHSRGHYMPQHRDVAKARRKYERAEARMRKYSTRLIADAASEKQAEIELEIATRRGAAISSALMLLVLMSSVTYTNNIEAQFDSEYNIDQFCSSEFVDVANPFRHTIVYYDESSVSELMNSRDSESVKSIVDHLNTLEWITVLESKLRGSLQPSERVTFISLAHGSDVVRKEVGEFCWPDYTDQRRREIENRGFVGSFFSRDPIEDLDSQRDVFFARILQGIAENTFATKSTKWESGKYVKALIREESRFRPRGNESVRVIWYGRMLEKSNYGEINGTEDASEFARNEVERTSLNLGGTVFYLYGISQDEHYEESKVFWDELIHRAGGYLGSFGSDLALTAQAPLESYSFEIEIDMAPPENVRRGRIVLSVSESGELIDSTIVVAGQNRAVVSGQMKCEQGGSICDSKCSIEAEMQRSVVFRGLEREALVLNGIAGAMTGFIGQRDEGQDAENRAYKAVRGRMLNCDV